MTKTETIAAARRLAQAAGYYIAEGSYHGTTDDRIGRWYVGRDGEPFRPYGAGHRAKGEAWAIAAEQARMDQDCGSKP